MTLEEIQSLGAIPAVVLVTLFALVFVMILRYERRRVATLRADWMQEQRDLAALRTGTSGVVATFMPAGSDFDAGGFRQQGAMQFDGAASDDAYMDQSRWIDTSDWSSMNPCAIGGPGPGNNFGHSAGLSHDGWSDR